MKYRKLGNTDLNVSALCLGTMTWGKQNTQDEAFAQLDYALERGINFIDTVRGGGVEPDPPSSTLRKRVFGSVSYHQPSHANDLINGTTWPSDS